MTKMSTYGLNKQDYQASNIQIPNKGKQNYQNKQADIRYHF